MFEFLIDNIFLMFGGHVFQQTVSISMGTNCTPLFVYLFLHSYEANFIQGVFKCGNKLDPSFNYPFRDIDDVLPLNNMHNQSNMTDATCGA